MRYINPRFTYLLTYLPDRTRADFFARPGPQTRVSDKVRGLCLVGSGRARVVEFSYTDARIGATDRSVRRGDVLAVQNDRDAGCWGRYMWSEAKMH